MRAAIPKSTGAQLKLELGSTLYIWRSDRVVPDVVEVQSRIMMDCIGPESMGDNNTIPRYYKEELRVRPFMCSVGTCWYSDPTTAGACYIYSKRDLFSDFAGMVELTKEAPAHV